MEGGSTFVQAFTILFREGLEAMFDPAFGEYLDWVAAHRRRVRAEEPDQARRMARVREAIRGLRVEGKVVYPEAWRKNT